MPDPIWSLEKQLALVAVVVALATTIAILIRSRQRLYVRFAIFASSVAAFYLSTLAFVPARIFTGAAVVIAATLFFDAILGEAGLGAQKRRRKTFVAASGMIIIGVTPFANELWGQGVVAGIAITLLALRANAMFVRAREVESRAERTRLRYLAYGGAVALIGFCADLASHHFPILPFGGATVAIYLYFISQTLMRSRLLDLHELLGKGLVFGTLALILAIVYGVLLLWVGDRRGLFLFNTLLASSLILILFEPLKTILEETTTRVFFGEHVNFARAMRRLQRRLATVIELRAAVDVALTEIYEQKRATHVSVYLLESDRMGFVLQGHRGPKPIGIVDSRSHPTLVAQLMREAPPVLREAIHTRIAKARGFAELPEETGQGLAQDEAITSALDALRADAVVPIRAGDELLGFLCLRDERLTDAYGSDELAALVQVAEQLAINAENSRVFMQLRERDRLATLGEMSAGLAHEIRNPLAAIKAAAQEIEPTSIPEGDQELFEIIVAEVNRLNTVVSQFLDYARPFRGTFSTLSANDCVRRTVQLLARDLGRDVEVEVDLRDPLPDINGDAEQLQQVLINLVLNAAEAMERKGKIEISTRQVETRSSLFGLRDADEAIEIRVRDYGPGIPEEVRENLFIPFFTTKTRGTGLGLPLCQRIVQHHSGALEVHSVAGQGAMFSIRIPVLKRSLPKESESAQPAAESSGGLLAP